MKKNFNYADKEWDAIDVTEEMQGTFAVDILSYFDELEDEETVCTLFLNDIHIESQLENIALIKNAPALYRLFVQAENYLPPELLAEWHTIQKALNKK
jgi:arginine decarboxylase-like protein